MQAEIYSKTNCVYCDKAKIRLAKYNPRIFMLDKEIEQSTSPAVDLNGFGWSEKEKWQSLHDFLLEYRSIDKAIDINLVYTNQFLGKSIESDKKTILDRIGLGKN